MARPQLDRDEYVTAALDFVDEHGFDALTLRALGTALGASHTAIYRHFPDRAALLTAVAEHLVIRAMAVPPPASSSPRQRIVHRFARIKAEFSAHPNVVAPSSTAGGSRPALLAWCREVIGDLEGMGLAGERLVLAFRLLESFGVGTTIFDLGGAPDHLELRRQRLRALEHPAFDEATRTAAEVGATNDAAYALGLDALLDACEAMAG